MNKEDIEAKRKALSEWQQKLGKDRKAGWVTIASFETDMKEVERLARQPGKPGDFVASAVLTRWLLAGEEKSAQNIGLTNISGKEDIMRRENFNKLVEDVIDEIRARLLSKGNHYADNDNVFRNFDNAAKMRGITPIQALEGMLLKHQVSIQDIVEGRSPNKREVVWEKVLDEICYRILEIGLLRRDEDAPF